MRTETITLYKFDELSEKAKEKALDWARDYFVDLYPWHDENVQSLKEFADWLGVNFDYSVQGGGYGPSWAKVKFEDNSWGSGYAHEEDSEIPLAELSGKFLLDFLKNRSATINKPCPFTGYYMDEDLLQPMRDYLTNPDPDTTLQDLVDMGVEAWVKSYVSDWDWHSSDEGLTDFLENNEYEFTENGDIR